MGVKGVSTNDRQDIAIRVDRVGKVFPGLHRPESLKNKIVGIGARHEVTGPKQPSKNFVALQDISFEVRKGEFFGIVGRNGCGKSTLLKMLAGVYQPSEGTITITGKLTPFIELGVGFNPELTGHDNVFLNGALLGFGRKEMQAMYDDIVAFAELENFMQTKLKNYSSGMQVRLAFSIATRCQSDILLLDEVLAVGDAAFQQKCFDYFADMKKSGRTICFVSHDADAMRKYCERGVFIENGRIKKIGTITNVLDEYQKSLAASIEQQEQSVSNTSEHAEPIRRGVVLAGVSCVQEGSVRRTLEAHKPFTLRVRLECEKRISDAIVGVNILTHQGQLLHAFNTQHAGLELTLQKGSNIIEFSIDNVLTDGKYEINVAVVGQPKNALLLREAPAASFRISGVRGHKYSIIHPRVTASVRDV